MLTRPLVAFCALACLAPLGARAQTTDQGKPHVQITDASIGAGDKVTWTKDKVYVLNGFVYAEAGAELTIEPGTVVKARPGQGTNASALIITMGARIFANGTRDEPIIFTSVSDSVALPDYLEAGDNVDYRQDRSLWGGIVLCGRSTNNQGTNLGVEGLPTDDRARHGGTDEADNSGTMRYVQIKYSGSVIESNKELQSLTLASVGSGTTIDYVESFNSGDDGFEFFGGTVNTRHLVTAFADDDAFDYDQGLRGKHQFWFAIQAPTAGDKLGEFDSGDAPTVTATPLAHPVIYNATFLGRGAGHTKSALIYKEYGGGEMWNAIIGDFGSGVAVDVDSAAGETAYTRFTRGEIALHNDVFFSPGGKLSNRAAVAAALQANGNRSVDAGLTAISRLHTDALRLDPRPAAGSPALMGAAAPPADGFFTATDYVGAFAPGEGGNWAGGWTALAYNGILTDAGTPTALVPAEVPLPGTVLASAPNPTGGRTTVTFTLEKAQRVSLRVYDVLGREVETLVDGVQGAGTWQVDFDAARLAPGTYLYRLTTETGTMGRTMTVVR